MADGSNIEWTEATWNPVTGCTKVSPGCRHCYAERLSYRLQAMGKEHYRNGFRLALHEDALAIPFAWRSPRLVFVNSMSDLFHEGVPLSFIQRVFQVMTDCPHHTFQVLTKRPKIAAEHASQLNWPKNVWLGASIERVRLFFVEEFLPYSWAFLPADASLQCSFRGDSNQASAYPRLSGGQPSLETVPKTVGLSPLRRAPFWTFARRSGTVPWEGRQACDGCDDRIPGTYIRRAANRRPLHRSPEPSPVRSGRCCLRGCQSLPLVQRSPADERERTRTGTAPAGSGFGTQAPARTSRPTQPERGCWSGRGHQRCRVLGAARARKPRRNDLRDDAGCGSGLRAARSRRLASA